MTLKFQGQGEIKKKKERKRTPVSYDRYASEFESTECYSLNLVLFLDNKTEINFNGVFSHINHVN